MHRNSYSRYSLNKKNEINENNNKNINKYDIKQSHLY